MLRSGKFQNMEPNILPNLRFRYGCAAILFLGKNVLPRRDLRALRTLDRIGTR